MPNAYQNYSTIEYKCNTNIKENCNLLSTNSNLADFHTSNTLNSSKYSNNYLLLL